MADDLVAANLAPSAFAGTAEDYARFRPPYPARLLDHVLAATPARGRLLDLACGPGRIALVLASEFETVLAVDLERDMIAVGRRRAEDRGIANIRWECARAENVELPERSLDLITIGEAFHRLEQGTVLKSAARWLSPGGVLATMGGGNILHGSRAWHRTVFEVAEEWTRDVFPGGWATALPGAENERARLRELFEQQGFVDIVDYEFSESFTWTIDGVLGYLRSMSVCSPAVLGERRASFEVAVRSALAELTPTEEFEDELRFDLTVMSWPRQ